MRGAVLTGSIDGQSYPYTANLKYRYSVETSTFDGSLVRKCLRRRSAQALAEQVPGSTIDVRVKPGNPARSYAPLPIGWGGFVVAGLPVFGLAALVGFLTYAVVEKRYVDARDAIPESEWQLLDASRAFQLEMPGTATATSNPLFSLEVGGGLPHVQAWLVGRSGGYFYAGVLEYPPGSNLNGQTLDHVLAAIKSQNPERYVYQDELITRQRRVFREFRFTRPYTTMRVHIDRERLYVMATTWNVQHDVSKFFNSLRVTE